MRTRLEIYCDILYWGLLNIRNHSDDRARCFAEADHLHHIPELLHNLENEDLHRFYWDVTRPCFIEHSEPGWLVQYDELWQELDNANRLERQANCQADD